VQRSAPGDAHARPAYRAAVSAEEGVVQSRQERRRPRQEVWANERKEDMACCGEAEVRRASPLWLPSQSAARSAAKRSEDVESCRADAPPLIPPCRKTFARGGARCCAPVRWSMRPNVIVPSHVLPAVRRPPAFVDVVMALRAAYAPAVPSRVHAACLLSRVCQPNV